MKSLLQHITLSILCILLFGNISLAQDESESNELLYVADYQVAWQHFPEWTEIHHEHTVPALEALVEDGTITGWSAWQHHTGSEYNWRMVIQAAEWDDFDAFWDGYFNSFSEELGQRVMPMIGAHRDQIWDLSEMNISESAGTLPYAYEALYQVNFGDMEAWNKDWKENMVPVLEKAMEEGILAGWAVLDHNAGDRFNKSQILLFNDWDHIDDVQDSMMGSLFSDPDRWQKVAGMISAHDDVIWHQVTNENDNNKKGE